MVVHSCNPGPAETETREVNSWGSLLEYVGSKSYQEPLSKRLSSVPLLVFVHTYLTPETQGSLSVITKDSLLLGILQWVVFRTMGRNLVENIVYAGSLRNTRAMGRVPLGTLVEMQSGALSQEHIILCTCSLSPCDS